MTSKEYLSQVYKLDHKIHLLKLELDDYNRLANSPPGQDFTRPRVNHTPSNEAYFVKWIEKASEKEIEIKEELKRLDQLKGEVMAAIDEVGNQDYRVLLKFRYIHSMEFPDIAKKMMWSLSTIKRMHREALEVFIVPEKVA